jgi:hypothetical protein
VETALSSVLSKGERPSTKLREVALMLKAIHASENLAVARESLARPGVAASFRRSQMVADPEGSQRQSK